MTELRIRRTVTLPMFAVMMGILVLTPAGMALAMGQPAFDIYMLLYHKVVERGITNIFGFDLLQGLVGMLVLLFMIARQRVSRLMVSAQGIELRIDNRFVRWFVHPWRLGWSQVSEVVLRGPMAAHTVLEFHVKGGKPRKLNVADWVRPEMLNGGGLSLLRMTYKQPSPQESSLILVLAGYGIHVVDQIGADTARLGFALEKNLYSRIGLAILTVLAAYAFVDGIVAVDEAYAGDAPLPAFLVAGALVAIAAIVLLARAGVPSAESVGLGALIGVAFGLALYPATLRVNALSDAAGLGQYEYVLKSGAMLHPKVEGPPVLQAPLSLEFWAAQRIGSIWSIELRHGGLGLWQYRRDPLLEHIRDYHERARD